MNYIFSHIGNIPNHLLDSIESVNIVDSNSNIFLISDKIVDIPYITHIGIDKKIVSDQTIKMLNSNYWAYDPNPLWKTAMYRIFLVRDVAKYIKANEYVHFDGDVILYDSFENIKDSFDKFDGINITPCNDNELVFGYSHFGSIDAHNELCNEMIKIASQHGRLNEMQLLSLIQKSNKELIRSLPTIPQKIKKDFIFDPSSYGQFFGGEFHKKQPGWYGTHHWIGAEIGNGNIIPKMIDGKPFIKSGKWSYPIANLHIHSKNTKPFLNKLKEIYVS